MDGASIEARIAKIDRALTDADKARLMGDLTEERFRAVVAELETDRADLERSFTLPRRRRETEARIEVIAGGLFHELVETGAIPQWWAREILERLLQVFRPVVVVKARNQPGETWVYPSPTTPIQMPTGPTSRSGLARSGPIYRAVAQIV